ncbi:MAG: L-histidine N(alpha)-methyltransferase [Fimbriimonas sp.]|nr:L-histidine N(alpha)-methyltransferase [Fimbriimonas sp.]
MKFIEVKGDHPKTTFCQAVDEGLSAAPKSLPTLYLYDHRGSELFEEITCLPEYYPTRTEQSILERVSSEIVEAVGGDLMIVEFGSGSSTKTRLLLSAALDRQRSLPYVPIDISTEFLKQTSLTLLRDFDRLTIQAMSAEYFDAIAAMPEHSGPRLMLFLGSNIGNLTHEEATSFLAQVRSQMKPKDRILIGIDLVKERTILEDAYNDRRGVTAEFNLNLLRRINRELDGNFDLSGFYHSAPYDEREQRIEMRLFSLSRQIVDIDGTGGVYSFTPGEFIHTEWSHKYTLDSFRRLCRPAGLELDATWRDERDWFAMILLRPDAP